MIWHSNYRDHDLLIFSVARDSSEVTLSLIKLVATIISSFADSKHVWWISEGIFKNAFTCNCSEILMNKSDVNWLHPAPVTLHVRTTLLFMSSNWRFTLGEAHSDQVLLSQAGKYILNCNANHLLHIFVSWRVTVSVFAKHWLNEWRQKAWLNNWIKAFNTHIIICKRVTNMSKIQIRLFLNCCLKCLCLSYRFRQRGIVQNSAVSSRRILLCCSHNTNYRTFKSLQSHFALWYKSNFTTDVAENIYTDPGHKKVQNYLHINA